MGTLPNPPPQEYRVCALFPRPFAPNRYFFFFLSLLTASYIPIHGSCDADVFPYLGKACVIVRGNILPVSPLPNPLFKSKRRFITYQGHNYLIRTDNDSSALLKVREAPSSDSTCGCGRARFQRGSAPSRPRKAQVASTCSSEEKLILRPTLCKAVSGSIISALLQGWSSKSPQRGAYMADAALRGDLELMKLLRALGCNYSEAERFGPRVSFIAATHHHRHILDHLISEGILLFNEVSHNGSTLAHVAATQNDVSLLNLIYDQWACIMPEQPIIALTTCCPPRGKRSFTGKLKSCPIHREDTDFGPAGLLPFSGYEISPKCPFLAEFSHEFPFPSSGSASVFATDSPSGPSVDRATSPSSYSEAASPSPTSASRVPTTNSFALFLSRLHNNCTAAMMAGKLQHVEVLRWLQEHGDAQLQFQGQAHIGGGLARICGASGSLSMARWLTSTGLSPYTCTEEGDNLAITAARAGHLPLLQWLLDELSFDFFSSNSIGETAVLAAAHSGRIDVLQWMLDQGMALKEHRTNLGRSAIHLAATAGKLDTVIWLAEHDFSIGDKTYLGNTVMSMAAKEGHIAVLEWLTSKGAPLSSSPVDGATPILQAAFFGHFPVLKWFHKHGFALNDCYLDGLTIAHIAACQGRLDIISWLAAHGYPINLPSHTGPTPLDMAHRHQHHHVVSWLKLQEGMGNHSDR